MMEPHVLPICRDVLRLARLHALKVILALALAITPGASYACGMYISREGDAQVAQERALIRWDGGTEDLVMEFNLQGSSKEAAWILPVPAPATVKLGHPQLFDTLQALTKPLVRVEKVPPGFAPTGGGAPPGSAPVTVLERQTLGPFEVSTLMAREARALSDWLTQHGYRLPDGLAAALQPYIEQQWYYVAVRLAPDTPNAALQGALDPLWVTFESDTIIYPIRTAALAGKPLAVFLYVLADHRVDIPSALTSSEPQPGSSFAISFADWVVPASLDQQSPLAPLVPRTLFLTKFEGNLSSTNMQDDLVFPLAARDEIYHSVEVQYVYTEDANAVAGGGAGQTTAGGAAPGAGENQTTTTWVLAVSLVVAILVLTAIGLFVGVRKRRRTNR